MNETQDTAVPMESGANSIGEDLRQARESLGLSIDEAAQAIKLSTRQIRQMETGDFAGLGSLPFARGFVRNYARHLKLDENAILDRLHAHLTPTELHAPINDGVAMPRTDGRRPLPWLMAVSPLLLVAVVGTVFYFGGFSLQSLKASWSKPTPSTEVKVASTESKSEKPVILPVKQETPAPQAPATQVKPESTPPVAVAPVPTTPEAPAAVPAPPPVDPSVHRVTLNFKEEAWLDIKDGNGKQLEAHLQRAGSSRSFEGKPPFAMVVGNADKVELRYDDQDVDLRPYTRVNVARLKVE